MGDGKFGLGSKMTRHQTHRFTKSRAAIAGRPFPPTRRAASPQPRFHPKTVSTRQRRTSVQPPTTPASVSQGPWDRRRESEPEAAAH